MALCYWFLILAECTTTYYGAAKLAIVTVVCMSKIIFSLTAVYWYPVCTGCWRRTPSQRGIWFIVAGCRKPYLRIFTFYIGRNFMMLAHEQQIYCAAVYVFGRLWVQLTVAGWHWLVALGCTPTFVLFVHFIDSEKTTQILAIRIVTAVVMRTLCREKSSVFNHLLNLRFMALNSPCCSFPQMIWWLHLITCKIWLSL